MNTSAASAKKYYSEAYYQEGGDTLDYYAEKTKGWQSGRSVGAINKVDFAALCNNLHPTLHNTLKDRRK